MCRAWSGPITASVRMRRWAWMESRRRHTGGTCGLGCWACSYGFRPQRSAHDALRALNRVVYRGEVNWILEADIVSFFDSLDRIQLKKMLQHRVADGSLLRLVGKCLHVGVLDGAEYSEPDQGTTQGSVISPLLGNVYLHYVLDLWFERVVKPRLRGKAILLRYCDDFIMGFERREDAERVMGM